MVKPINSFIQLLTFNLLCLSAFSQNTVGVTYSSNEAEAGYTLFSPNTSNNSYLIDNCGQLINSWEGSYTPGLMAYLLEDGSLLRTGKIPNVTFTQGGVGGYLEMIDWSGNQIWSYQYSNDSVAQHHDIEMLPNGNILILASELKSREECISAGRDSTKIQGDELWPEHIVEIKIQGDFTTVIWEWHAWDHLIQDFDSTKSNYGVVADHPELFNLNFYKNQGPPDWQHFNSIDYNAELDQILLSSKAWNEIYIIDHSCSSLEASTHTGGNSGMGGDLLYRWGNPRAYDSGNSNDQKLFDQHDANWIEDGMPNAGNIIIFNNTLGLDYSSVDIIKPPINVNNLYDFVGNTFGPDSASWRYVANPPSDMYSQRISGASMLENGNVLICSGVQGTFFEVDSNKMLVWKYINPINNGGITSQGDVPAISNQVFRALKYPVDFAGFTGQDMTPGDPLEINWNLNNCTTGLPTESLDAVSIYPNPSQNFIVVSNANSSEVRILDSSGRSHIETQAQGETSKIDISKLSSGVYFVFINGITYKFIKTH